MSEEERRECLVDYESRKSVPFDNRHVLENYFLCTKAACRVFKREFMHIGKIDVFVDWITIESACNKVLGTRFLKPDTIGHIPTDGYTCNNKHSKKTLIWFLHMEQTDGVRIIHCRNWSEYNLPNFPRFSVDDYCP